MRNSTVGAVNRLTARWAAQAPDGDAGTVLTAAGVWPLLAFLADGSAGAARAELSGALGIPADAAAGEARELLSALERVRGLRAATGLWTAEGMPWERRWLAELPPGTRGSLTGDADVDRKALDAWAAGRTDGLIERMPAPLAADTPFVLASALTLRIDWIRPFTEWSREIADGPWAGRTVRMLHRHTALPDRVRVAHGTAGAVTLLEVVGAAGVDVHLVLGEPEAPAGDTLGTGIAAVTRALPTVGARALPLGAAGPGLFIDTVRTTTPEPLVSVATAAFEVRAEHNLLDQARLFGLEAARDVDGGHFPGISGEPLGIGSARQSALARFHAEGFDAAAVTAFAAVGAGLPRLRYRVRRVAVTYDRPFGFLAVHRASRLVLAAGWVTEPEEAAEWREDEEEEEEY
ncbi:serpin family protein [Streptomyces sp. NPDC085612]|uniref:serpin family protein n=1 Tax=Streptomyces sp. NPDC085612 TaxID=3365732 RepID=UPI0037CF4BB5